MNGRRVMGVPVSANLLFDWLVEGAEIRARCVKGLPSDARALHAYHDAAWGRVVFVFEHESFEEVHEGMMLPMLGVEFERLGP